MTTVYIVLVVLAVSIAFVAGMLVGSAIEKRGQADTDALQAYQLQSHWLEILKG